MSDELSVTLSRAELGELLSPRSAIFDFDRDRDRLRRSLYDKLGAAFENGRPAHRVLAGSFEDDRGRIQDLIDGPIDSVTRISTVEGAVRGNHLHRETIQWTFILSGSLLVANVQGEKLVGPGEMVVDRPGEPHAWKALEDTDCLVFTQGPRSGENYEQDTYRLETPLLA